MKNKSVIATILIIGASLLFISQKSTSIDCASELTLQHGPSRINAAYIFKLYNNEGVISVKGIGSDQTNKAIISREIHFTYSKIKNNYLLDSNHIVTFSEDNLDDSSISYHYPDFFIKGNSKLSLNFKRVDFGNYIVSINESPVFYCYSH